MWKSLTSLPTWCVHDSLTWFLLDSTWKKEVFKKLESRFYLPLIDARLNISCCIVFEYDFEKIINWGILLKILQSIFNLSMIAWLIKRFNLAHDVCSMVSELETLILAFSVVWLYHIHRQLQIIFRIYCSWIKPSLHYQVLLCLLENCLKDFPTVMQTSLFPLSI